MTGQSDRYKLFADKLIRLIVLAKRVAGKPGRAVTALPYGIAPASAWAV